MLAARSWRILRALQKLRCAVRCKGSLGQSTRHLVDRGQPVSVVEEESWPVSPDTGLTSSVLQRMEGTVGQQSGLRDKVSSGPSFLTGTREGMALMRWKSTNCGAQPSGWSSRRKHATAQRTGQTIQDDSFRNLEARCLITGRAGCTVPAHLASRPPRPTIPCSGTGVSPQQGRHARPILLTQLFSRSLLSWWLSCFVHHTDTLLREAWLNCEVRRVSLPRHLPLAGYQESSWGHSERASRGPHHTGATK